MTSFFEALGFDKYLLSVIFVFLGLSSLCVAGFLVAIALGFVTVGISCLLLGQAISMGWPKR